MYPLARQFLFRIDAERAHGLGLHAIEAAYRSGLNPLLAMRPAPLKTRVFGVDFPNPVGCAAGLDKNGEHIDALMALGFGFVEIGTTTPRPQPGNPKPRMFRLPEHQAVINRLGFNNLGVDALVRNVEKAKRNGILGINIGKNKDTPNDKASDDYIHCMERVFALADYITVNISSPNTSGLQEEETLRRFIGTLREAQERLASQHGRRTPMLVKVAPDLSDDEINGMASVLNAARIDGVIIGNTTLDRSEIQGHPRAGESGGLSGQPLYARSTTVLRKLRLRLDDSIPLIGVGGILSGADAAGKIAAGARMVQFYTGMIYRGPELIGECVGSIRRLREGVA
ncbi:MAG: quinone-dependent dihydroorotate dehydrogenase [Gammaproteobacteria bacterium]|nr:quinone-dependent dihydroorotate dehydrogenase [Gammaproteobacteria bacterium]